LSWWTHYLLRHYGEYVELGNDDEFRATSRWVLAAVVTTQVGIGIANLLIVIEPDAGTTLCLVTAAFVATRAINQYKVVLSSARADVLGYSVYATSGPVFGLVIGLLCLWQFGADAIWPLFGYVVGELAALLFGLARASRASLSPKPEAKILMAGLRYGAPLALASAFSWLALNLPRFAVDASLGIEAAGRYAVGYGLGLRAASLAAMAVTVAALPLAFQQNTMGGRDAAMRQLARNGALFVAVMLPALAGLYLISPLLVPLLVAPEYSSSTLLLLPWSLVSGGVVAITSHYLNHVFFIDRQTSIVPAMELLSAIATAVLCYFLLEYVGLVGAVAAVAIPRILMALALAGWLVLRRGLVVPAGDFRSIGLAVGAMTFAVSSLPQRSALITLVAKVIVGAAVYAFVMTLLYREPLQRSFRKTSE
jgi:O-antigen/teichoic acid export membrane protein